MTYSLVGGKVVRDDGYIAVQHRNANATAVKVGDIVYNFSSSHNVSLAWILPEHLAVVLTEMARICCGQSSKKYFLATVINVNIWTYGNREGV